MNLPRVTDALRGRNAVSEIRLDAITTMRVGGPALLVQLERAEDLVELRELNARALGKGANLLVGEQELAEPIVRFGTAFDAISVVAGERGRTVLRVGAAVDLARVIGECVRGGLSGPEGLAGVPATVGGALAMNAGTRTVWILDLVRSVHVLLPGEREAQWLPRSALNAGYRHNGLPAGTWILGCEFDLAAGDPAVLKANATKLKQAKAATQPLAARSAGCVFKNPSPELPAGKLIQELGMKGARVGGAEVSPIHANFIVNSDNACSNDVIELIRLIRAKAWAERGVALELEVRTWNCPADVLAHPAGKPEVAHV